MNRKRQKCALATALFGAVLVTSCSQKPEENTQAPKLKPIVPSAAPRTAVEAKSTVWEKVDESSFNWNGRGPVKLVAEIQKRDGNAGDFTRVRIEVPGEKEFVLDNKDGWIKFNGPNSPFRWSNTTRALAKAALARHHSENFMFVDVGAERQALLLVSWGYASDPSRLHVLELPKEGSPVVVFNDLLDIGQIQDLNSDGLKEIVGAPCLSQSFGEGLITYDPLHVLQFGPSVGSKLKLSIPLSKAYNEKHLYGWAGPDCSEKLAVYIPEHGRAKILLAEEAERLAEAAAKK
jgi:hypothetical protein